MTGRYNWRSRLKSGVLGGLSPRLIEPDRLTVPAFLSNGLLHRLHWQVASGHGLGAKRAARPFNDTIENGEHGGVRFLAAHRTGPTASGFDYYFGISASLDMVPYTFIENDRVTEIPAVKSFPMMPGGRTV